jgi:hypothetical protein
MVPFMSHASSHIPALFNAPSKTSRRPIGAASGISLGLIIAAGAAAIIAFHAISFLAQMIATPIILGIGIGIAVHIVLYGPKESLKCAVDLLGKAPRAIQTVLTKAPAVLEHIAHIATRILPKALQHVKTRVTALPLTASILQAVEKPEPPKKQNLPVRILKTVHSHLTPKLIWLAAKTVSLPFKVIRSLSEVIVTPVVYGVVALAVVHIALRPEPSKKIAKDTLLAAPKALRAVATGTWNQSQQVLGHVATTAFKAVTAPGSKAPQMGQTTEKGGLCLDL